MFTLLSCQARRPEQDGFPAPLPGPQDRLPRVRCRASIREMRNVSGHPEHGPSSFQTFTPQMISRCGRPPSRAPASRERRSGGRTMKAYATQSIRNVGIAGHGDTGKTQLVSSLLFTAGMTTRLGKVAEGNTVTDWDEEEIARKITIHTGLAYAEWAPSAAAQARKNKNQFSGHAGLQHVSERHARVAGGGGRRADRGGRRGGRAGGHGKSVGLRDRVRRAARVRSSTGWTASWRITTARWSRSRACSAATSCRCNCRSARRKRFAAWSI